MKYIENENNIFYLYHISFLMHIVSKTIYSLEWSLLILTAVL